jgi:hypothetical protein
MFEADYIPLGIIGVMLVVFRERKISLGFGRRCDERLLLLCLGPLGGVLPFGRLRLGVGVG